MIYFDHNATTPLSPAARGAWLKAADEFPANASSPHRLGARADAALTQAREKLARILGCDAMDLVWTSGATESNNTVLHHFARTLPENKEIWISAIEHPCVLAPARHYFGSRVRRIPASRDGVVELDWIRDQLQSGRGDRSREPGPDRWGERPREPGLVAVMAANNEIGVLQPWEQILQLCRELDIPFFCDAAQWIGKMPALGLGQCDWVSGCAHKFGGPKGVGFLKTPAKGSITPLLLGGPQEEGRRPGTENVASIAAMIAALEEAELRLKAHEEEERRIWREEFEKEVVSLVPGTTIVAQGQPRLWNTVAALMPQADCQQRWVVKLDKAGFAVSTGSACSSGKEKPSHVLSAMGFRSDESSRMLRFSSGWGTKREDWLRLGEAIVSVQEAMPKSGN